MNDFEPHSFSNFLIFSSQGDNDDGREGDGVAEGCRWEGGEGVGHISVKIKLNRFLPAFNPVTFQVDVHVHVDFY